MQSNCCENMCSLNKQETRLCNAPLLLKTTVLGLLVSSLKLNTYINVKQGGKKRHP